MLSCKFKMFSLWIGGVSLVTTVLTPAIKIIKSKEEKFKTFETIKGKFVLQAKVTILITGLSGFYAIRTQCLE
jgi:uncharacterized membrane protein